MCEKLYTLEFKTELQLTSVLPPFCPFKENTIHLAKVKFFGTDELAST